MSSAILAAQPESGTSIFDPVLCEVVYRWFCPPGGSVLDPFAGGSVRGIVAAKLGYRYTGVDLRTEQIEANRVQWQDIKGRPVADATGSVTVKVSAKMARLPFNGCEPDYIKNVCHAGCEFSSSHPDGIMVTIHPSEQAKIEELGGKVQNGMILPVLTDTVRGRRNCCPFQEAHNGLCSLHFTPHKPFGCIASPFTLNKSNTLIVRHRYISLKCYNDGRKLPAYVAFRASLDLIFGPDESARICDHLENGGGDIHATMPFDSYQKLKENDAIKRGEIPASTPDPDPDLASAMTEEEDLAPQWLVGDSRDVATLAPGPYDLIFSCPPYGDLERYSDDPADISTLKYPEFLAAYRAIVAASVAMLKPDRFAVFVVGDIRDKRGFYRGFIGDTVAAFQAAGATLYNEAILVTAVGSLPIRVGKQFGSYRKLGKTHQQCLVFFNGDPKRIPHDFGEVETGDGLVESSDDLGSASMMT